MRVLSSIVDRVVREREAGCCHTGRNASSVIGMLRSVDPSLSEKSDSAVWHGLPGTGSGGDASREVSLRALSVAWVAATKNNEEWSALTPAERLARTEAYDELVARVESGDVVLTENQVAKLGFYARGRRKPGIGRRVAMAAATAMVAVTGLVGGVMPAAAAPGDGVTISATAGFEQMYTVANKSNAALVHAKPVKGKCAPDFVIAKASVKHKANFGKKYQVVKKGAKTCIQVGASYSGNAGSFAPMPKNSAGVITALPSDFPKNPSAADIEALGAQIAADGGRVDPGLRVPQPSQPKVAAELADHVKLVRVSTPVQDPKIPTIYNFTAEWEIQGGSGVLDYYESGYHSGDKDRRFVSLQPGGSIRVVQQSGGENINGTLEFGFMGEGVTPDYGQGSLPASLTKDWKPNYNQDMEGGRWDGKPGAVGKRASSSNYTDTWGAGTERAEGRGAIRLSDGLVSDNAYGILR